MPPPFNAPEVEDEDEDEAGVGVGGCNVGPTKRRPRDELGTYLE